MPELVTVPISFFECTVDYVQPIIRLLGDRAAVVQSVFDALKPWNPNIDDIELRNTGKSSEQGVNFGLPLKRVSFFLGPSYCRLTRDDADWVAAEETIAILEAALSALVLETDITVRGYRTAIALHLQPRKMSFVEILRPFVAPQLAGLEKEPFRTMAAIAKWPTRKVTIDGSGAIANAVFVKLEREFESSSTYGEMAAQLKQDEEDLFKILGVEEDRG
jgi:hypothetical protein